MRITLMSKLLNTSFVNLMQNEDLISSNANVLYKYVAYHRELVYHCHGNFSECFKYRINITQQQMPKI